MKKTKLMIGLTSALTALLVLAGCSGSQPSTSQNESTSIAPTTIEKPSSSVDDEEAKAIQDAQNVTNMINALSESSSETEVLNALSAYNSLSDLAKSKISAETYNKLMSLVEIIRQRKEEERVQDVINAIDNLNDSSTAEEVMSVKELYDNLDERLKNRITNKDKLDYHVDRIKRADAIAMEKTIDNLPDPKDILMMEPDLLTKHYFGFGKVEEQYNALDDEDLSYLDKTKEKKLFDFKAELEKSVYVVLEGSSYEYSGTWEPLPRGIESDFETWDLDIMVSGNKQQIYATKSLYLTDTRAIGLMIRPSEECSVDYFSHMDESYESYGKIIENHNLEADKWNVVTTKQETPSFADDKQLSRFDFYSPNDNWLDTSDIELTSIIGIRKRSDDVDRYKAKLVEDKIMALNEYSTKEDVLQVLSEYNELTENAKAYISAEAMNKFKNYIKNFVIADIDVLIENSPTKLTEENYFGDYAEIKKVITEYNKLPNFCKDLIENKDKLATILNLYNSISIYFDASNPLFTSWDYGASALRGITIVSDESHGLVNKVNIVGASDQNEFSLRTSQTIVSYVGKTSIIIDIYNPTNFDVDCTLHGGYGTGWAIGGTHTLLSKQWNRILFDERVLSTGNPGEEGCLFFVFQGKENVPEGEWLISSVLDYHIDCEHKTVQYVKGTLLNGSGHVEYYECTKCHEAWADESKNIYLGNTVSDRSKIDITSDVALQVNWNRSLSIPTYESRDGYYFKNSLDNFAKGGSNAVESTDTKYLLDSKGYNECVLTLTNNTSASIKVDQHSRAWGAKYNKDDIILGIGESHEFVITKEQWNAEAFNGEYGFALLCYNLQAQSGGTIDVSKIILR